MSKVKIEPGPMPRSYIVTPDYGFQILIKGNRAILQLSENMGHETQDVEDAVSYLNGKCGNYVDYEDTIVINGEKKKFPWKPGQPGKSDGEMMESH